MCLLSRRAPPSQRQCDALLVQRFKEHLIRRAEAGAPDYKETLLMTPCDWWPFLRGRTLWLVGDSITQVGALQRKLTRWHGLRSCCLPAS